MTRFEEEQESAELAADELEASLNPTSPAGPHLAANGALDAIATLKDLHPDLGPYEETSRALSRARAAEELLRAKGIRDEELKAAKTRREQLENQVEKCKQAISKRVPTLDPVALLELLRDLYREAAK